MQRFYLPDFQSRSPFILTDESLVHQITTVLRSKPGDLFVFFDGEHPADYVYQLQEIKRKKEIVFVGKDIINKKGEKKQISLYQAIPNKLEKLEYIIQKGTEVGIKNFTFFRSERSQKLILGPSKIERLAKICVEAVEQSGRNIVPSLSFIDSIPPLSGEVLFFDPSLEDSLKLSEVVFSDSISFLVGPEGGWSEREIHQFLHLGYKKVSLGDFILRTETVASVVAFSLLQRGG